MDKIFKNYGKRFYQVGSDYIWPRESNRIMSEIVEKNGGQVVKQKYLKMDANRVDYDKIIQDINLHETFKRDQVCLV